MLCYAQRYEIVIIATSKIVHSAKAIYYMLTHYALMLPILHVRLSNMGLWLEVRIAK